MIHNHVDCFFFKKKLPFAPLDASHHIMRHISGVFQVYSILVRPAYTCKCHRQCPPSFPIPSTQTFSIWMLVCRICSSSNNPFLHVRVASWPSSEHLSKCLSQHSEYPAEHLRAEEPPVANHFPPHQLFRAASRPCCAGCFVPLPATINRGRRSSRDIRPM